MHERSGPVGASTVVLLHGWAATAGHNWKHLLDTLGEQHRVIAPDLPGHGRGPAITEAFRLVDAADHVSAVCEALGVEKATIVGYSMGGAIAQLLWERDRVLVEGLVLCATAMQLSGTFAERSAFKAIDALEPLSRFIPERIRRKVEERLVEQLGDESASVRDTVDHEHSLRAMLRVGKSIGRFDSRSWAKDIDVPTAVVATTLDSTVPVARQLALAAAIPGACTFTVVGDHGVILDAPERIAPRIVEATEVVTRRSRAHQRSLAALVTQIPSPQPAPRRRSTGRVMTSTPQRIDLSFLAERAEREAPVIHRTLELGGPSSGTIAT